MNDSPGKGHTAVRAQKRPRLSDGAPWQADELFPTPPWATRALLTHVLPRLHVNLPLGAVWEPCAGLGHMAHVICEACETIIATDKHVYDLADGGRCEGIHRYDFLHGDCDRLIAGDVDWIITNPPFGLAQSVAEKAFGLARVGVALLLRFQWLEGQKRYALFRRAPPFFAAFSERVAMCEGGWDPRCSTATAYAWFVWTRGRDGWNRPARADAGSFDGYLIPPCKADLSRPTDALLARRCVPGFVAPSSLRRSGKMERLDL